MTKENTDKPAEQSFWGQVFSANPQTIVTADNFDKAAYRSEKVGEGGDFWLTRLFQGEGFYGNPSDKMIILKNGAEVHEVPIEQLNQALTSGWRGTESWTGFAGRINKSIVRMLAPDLDQRHVFLCGPNPSRRR